MHVLIISLSPPVHVIHVIWLQYSSTNLESAVSKWALYFWNICRSQWTVSNILVWSQETVLFSVSSIHVFHPRTQWMIVFSSERLGCVDNSYNLQLEVYPHHSRRVLIWWIACLSCIHQSMLGSIALGRSHKMHSIIRAKHWLVNAINWQMS